VTTTTRWPACFSCWTDAGFPSSRYGIVVRHDDEVRPLGELQSLRDVRVRRVKGVSSKMRFVEWVVMASQNMCGWLYEILPRNS